jgi:hypothetical protein
MQYHPKELLYVCKRVASNPEDDAESVDSLLIMKLPERGDILIDPFSHTEMENLRNNENVRNINK